MTEQFSYMKGIHTILTTPFKENLELDLEGLKKNVEFGANSNVEALVALGSEGEFFSLTHEEKKQVIKTTVEAAAGKKPIIAGVSDSSTGVAVDLTEYSKEVGADAVIVTPPYYSAIHAKAIHAHLKEINNVGIPIVFYNVPGRQGYNLTPEFIAELCEYENIVAIKQATRDITEQEKTLALLKDKVYVFGGSESFMFPVLCLGHVGSSTTAATCMPQYFVDIYEAVQSGDLKKAKELYDRLEPFRRVCEKFGQGAVVKYISEKYFGLAGGPVRKPLITPNREQLDEVDSVINQIGVLNHV